MTTPRRANPWLRPLTAALLPAAWLLVLNFLDDGSAAKATWSSLGVAFVGGLVFAAVQERGMIREYAEHQDRMTQEYREFHEQMAVERATHEAMLSKPS